MGCDNTASTPFVIALRVKVYRLTLVPKAIRTVIAAARREEFNVCPRWSMSIAGCINMFQIMSSDATWWNNGTEERGCDIP